MVVFDERAKGHQNRDIAKYLCVDVREMENMWKRILRLLRKRVVSLSIHFSLKKSTKRTLAANNFAKNLLRSSAKN